jgi:hypothetical protein
MYSTVVCTVYRTVVCIAMRSSYRTSDYCTIYIYHDAVKINNFIFCLSNQGKIMFSIYFLHKLVFFLQNCNKNVHNQIILQQYQT